MESIWESDRIRLLLTPVPYLLSYLPSWQSSSLCRARKKTSATGTVLVDLAPKGKAQARLRRDSASRCQEWNRSPDDRLPLQCFRRAPLGGTKGTASTFRSAWRLNSVSTGTEKRVKLRKGEISCQMASSAGVVAISRARFWLDIRQPSRYN